MKKVNLTDTQKTGLEFLNLNTLIQRENYIKSVVDYNINKVEKAVLNLEELTGIKRNVWNNILYTEFRDKFPSVGYYDVRDGLLTFEEANEQNRLHILFETGNTAFYKLEQIDSITHKFQKQTYRDEWTQEANQTFDKRLIYMVAKLDSFGFIANNVNLSKDEIQTSVENDFEFWISATDNLNNYLGRVHARLIWVNCYHKASHYRFITTLKK